MMATVYFGLIALGCLAIFKGMTLFGLSLILIAFIILAVKK